MIFDLNSFQIIFPQYQRAGTEGEDLCCFGRYCGSEDKSERRVPLVILITTGCQPYFLLRLLMLARGHIWYINIVEPYFLHSTDIHWYTDAVAQESLPQICNYLRVWLLLLPSIYFGETVSESERVSVSADLVGFPIIQLCMLALTGAFYATGQVAPTLPQCHSSRPVALRRFFDNINATHRNATIIIRRSVPTSQNVLHLFLLAIFS